MYKITYLIDGFNFYHSLDNFIRKQSFPNQYTKYKWIDYRKLCESFLQRDQVIDEIYLFTALANWRNTDKNKVTDRHKIYLKALEEYSNIKVVYGKFKVKDVYCSNYKKIKGIRCDSCSGNMTKHEEKETDVNLALKLYELAIHSDCDEICLVSGDSDIGPALRMAQSSSMQKIKIKVPCLNKYVTLPFSYPKKKFSILFPYGIRSKDLKNTVGETNIKKVKEKHITTSELPQNIHLSNGTILSRPKEW